MKGPFLAVIIWVHAEGKDITYFPQFLYFTLFTSEQNNQETVMICILQYWVSTLTKLMHTPGAQFILTIYILITNVNFGSNSAQSATEHNTSFSFLTVLQ